MLNSAEKPTFPLEAMTRSLSRTIGAYVVAVFDCCRERKTAAMKPLTKGSNAAPSELEADNSPGRNLIIINGCEPNRSVAAKSPIAAKVIDTLRSVKAARISVIFPEAFNNFSPSEGGDVVNQTSHDILFDGPIPIEDDNTQAELAAERRKNEEMEAKIRELEAAAQKQSATISAAAEETKASEKGVTKVSAAAAASTRVEESKGAQRRV